ncbi:MAG: arabinofuranan 3-O-arabinosyltransferase [Actinomycetota bacterium]
MRRELGPTGSTEPDDDALQWTRRIGIAFSQRLWPTVVLFAALALLAVLTNHPGSYVADNRFEQFWSPGRRMLREGFLWDGTRDLGRVREEFWIGSNAMIAMLRGLGASPALAEHLFHAVLLVTGGAGMVEVMRVFRPRVGAEHVLAGLFFMFSPFSASFLLPSGLYLPYALAPWLLAAFAHGVRRERPWHWAAVFALVIFSAGTIDLPGVGYAALPLIPTAVYLVHVERTTRWRAVMGWTLVAGVLTLAVSAIAIAKVAMGASAFTRRLAETEAPGNSNVASSWAESWRGLGFWLSYIRDQTGVVRPQTAAYFTSAPLVLLTFAPGCAALFALYRTRWRPRLAFAAMALLSIGVMVGSYNSHATPYGRLLLAAYRDMPWLGGLRASYKAGAGLAMGVAALFAMGATNVPASLLRRSRHQWWPVAVAIGLISIVSFPFWTGHLYPQRDRMAGPVPDYWKEALSYLDGNNDGTRVLVLPGATRASYRWGFVGDDIFDALLRRPHVVPAGVPLSNPEAANVVASVARRIGTNEFVPATLAPIARRLGIGTIVVRNDLDWERMRLPRPWLLDAVRNDPGLERIASFGLPGSNVVAANDKSLVAFAETKLPPVEIYRIRDAVRPIRAQRAAPPLLVSGDGDAWAQMASRGLLSSAGVVRYTGDLTGAASATLLRRGSPVTVTDTNRRRLTLLYGGEPNSSQTLAQGEDIDRPTPQLFPRPGSQSVAWFPSATRVYSSSPASLNGFEPAFRAANAFDGNRATAWWTAGGTTQAAGAWLRADLRRPSKVSHVEVEIAKPIGAERRPSRVSIRLSDGSSKSITLVDGAGVTDFTSRRTSSVEVRIEAVEGSGLAPVGLREIRIKGLDLQERVQVPDDLFRAASRSSALTDALSTAPVAYQFERSRKDGFSDEETALRRRFRTAGSRSYRTSGIVRLDSSTSDQVVDAVIGGPVGAYGSSRADGPLSNRGGSAVDGRLDTGWTADAKTGTTLTVRFPEKLVDHIDVVTPASEQYSMVTQVRATVGSQTILIPLTPTPECIRAPGAPPNALCLMRGLAGITPTSASELKVEVTGVEPRVDGLVTKPMQIIEVFWDFAGNPPPPADAEAIRGCTDVIATLDQRPLSLRVDATYGQLLRGESVPVTSCSESMLAPGWHELNGDGEVRVDSLRFETGRAELPLSETSARVAVRATATGPSHMTARFRGTGPMLVTTGQSYDAGWSATANGKSLGRPLPGDTLSTWLVDGTGEVVVQMRYEPDRVFGIAVSLSLCSVALCLVLVAWRARRA